MILLVCGAVILAVAVALAILVPLVRPAALPLGQGGGRLDEASDELFRRRDRVYVELRDLEFDWRVGKVSAEDYAAARDQLETEAARILQAIDVEVATLGEEIEREVRRLRADRQVCHACGMPITPTARFCPACGKPLAAVAQ